MSDPSADRDDCSDLLVVGGGIHGLFAACDAALRGLSVTLVERADFGSGLSFNHQRTVHGGLRALEHGQIDKARQQIAERRTWALLAPHLLRPLPFLVATSRRPSRSRLALGAGLLGYDWLGRHRNRGLPAPLQLPAGRILSRDATLALFPDAARPGLTGGALWHDYQVRHPDRLNWLVALAAIRAGAVLLNYTEAYEALRDGDRVAGARVRDALTGETREVRARVTLLATGSGLPAAMRGFGVTGAPPFVRAMNALVARPAPSAAVAAPGRSGRMFTAVPWQGFLLVGTFQSEGPVDPAESAPPPGAIAEMIDEMRTAFPSLALTRADIRLVHHGLTPAIVTAGRADLLPDAQVIRHAEAGAPGLVSLVGVKFTTARLAAERAMDAILVELDRSPLPCRTAQITLPYGDVAGAETALAAWATAEGVALPPGTAAHLVDWYGPEAREVATFSHARGLLAGLVATTPVLAGEIAYAVERARARRLADVVLRRTALGETGPPDPAALRAAAALMGTLCGWTADRAAAEIHDVERRFDV